MTKDAWLTSMEELRGGIQLPRVKAERVHGELLVTEGARAAIVFHRGAVADGEPAVPDWRFQVDELFR